MARKQAQNEPHPFAADLRAVDLFEDLEPRDLDVLANVARDYHYDPGDVVVAEGDQSGRFHLIVSGRATVTVGDQVVAEFGPGSYFGELAMIDRQPRSATVTAAEELHTLSLASISMRPVLREHPEISFKMLEKLATHQVETVATLFALADKCARAAEGRAWHSAPQDTPGGQNSRGKRPRQQDGDSGSCSPSSSSSRSGGSTASTNPSSQHTSLM